MGDEEWQPSILLTLTIILASGFGNLVTMAWWSGLWLNEGFACFMQTWSANKIFPDWQMWNQFVTSDLASALRLDSLRSSHPIQVGGDGEEGRMVGFC